MGKVFPIERERDLWFAWAVVCESHGYDGDCDSPRVVRMFVSEDNARAFRDACEVATARRYEAWDAIKIPPDHNMSLPPRERMVAFDALYAKREHAARLVPHPDPMGDIGGKYTVQRAPVSP